MKDKEEFPSLIPVFDNVSTIGSRRLDDLNERDITLTQFLKTLTQNIRHNWHWSNADEGNVIRYLHNSLGSFCDDEQKIEATQKMFHVFWTDDNLREFFLSETKKFEAYHYHNDNAYLFSRCFEQLVLETCTTLNGLVDYSAETLKPFIDHCNQFRDDVIFKEMEEFNVLFNLPMEFVCHLGSHPDYKTDAERLVPGTYYSEDSQLYRKAQQTAVYFHDTVCSIRTETGLVSANPFPSMDMGSSRAERTTLQHVSHISLARILNVSVIDLIHQIIPDYRHPLKVLLKIENSTDGYMCSITLDTVTVDEQLVKRERTSNMADGLFLQTVERPENYLRPELTDLQKKLIGKEIVFKVNDRDGRSSFIYQLKTSFFYSTFFRKCQLHGEKFGHVLMQLRYLAVMAEQFRYMGRLTRTIFPTVLPKDNSLTEIINCKNPTLIFGTDGVTNEVVANDVFINDKSRVKLITGPNQNGKSRYIDSIAMNQIFFQAGWMIFGTSAQMSPKTDLRVHYVHSGVGIPGESRFSHECARMRNVFEQMNGTHPMIIVDEPYTGTNPGDAEQLLEEMLRACSEENVTVILTTHFHGLIAFVDALPNAQNLHCHVDDAGNFTYQIKEGGSTKSNALDVGKTAGIRYEQIKDLIKQRKAHVPYVPSEGSGEEFDDDLPF